MTASFVNDIHARLNSTPVREVADIRSVEDVERALERAARRGIPVAMAGGRHAVGGQQFVTDGMVLDMRGLDRAVDLDTDAGILEVEDVL